jgi:transcriptional regulator with XRE-family HTH domain
MPGAVSRICISAGMMTDGTSLRGRVAGAALRRYREAIGYQLEDAAQVLGCDRSKISRIETGLRGIRSAELRALLAEYGVDPGEQNTVEIVADRRAGRGWQDEYADVLPGEMPDFLALETAASRLLVYEPQQVPALLQTQDYALNLASADPGLTAGSQDRAAEAVMNRQQAVLGRGGLEVTVVLGEAALCQAVGGAAVMDAQLGQLAAFGEDLPGVTVQVLPFSRGAHAASGVGPLAVLELAGSPFLGVVHLGGLSGGVCLEDPAAVARHAGLFRHLRAAALPPGESARLIRDTAARYRPDGSQPG